MDGKPFLQIRNLTKTFGSFVALKDISLEIYEGEFVCFLGPSGCGKTTLLRLIAGLEEQDSGQIIQAGNDISRLPPSRRDFGIVFQSYALFPNLTVAKNIAYGLENQKLAKSEIESRVQGLLNLVGMSDAGRKYPAQLSGGQQQRVALARALALSPGLLLLDEPLSALDARVRAGLRSELAQLQRRLGVTTVMVTHDQEEALTMADRIVVMDQGTVQQVGTPQEIYQHPSTPFVANFVGEMNFLACVVESPGVVRWGRFALTVTHINGSSTGSSVTLAIRPEEIRVTGLDTRSNNTLPMRVEGLEFLGSFYRLRLGHDGAAPLVADVPMSLARDMQLAEQIPLSIQLPADLLRVYHG
jgi:iron(III) transport system ATP-binding protein